MRNLLMAFCLLLAACVPPPPQPPTPPPGEYTCESACARQATLGCELAQDTAEGATCSDVCINTSEGPLAVHWDVACLTVATNCNHCE